MRSSGQIEASNGREKLAIEEAENHPDITRYAAIEFRCVLQGDLKAFSRQITGAERKHLDLIARKHGLKLP